MAPPLLDTNVFLRHLRQDHPTLSPKATAILSRIEEGELQARTSDTVLFETVFTLQRTYREPRSAIADALLPLIEMAGIILPGKRLYRRAFDLYRSTSIGFADCYHVALMERLGISEILSFDTDFDRIPGIKRRES